jgi:hypothetical protein
MGGPQLPAGNPPNFTLAAIWLECANGSIRERIEAPPGRGRESNRNIRGTRREGLGGELASRILA